MPNLLSLTFARISEAKWSERERQSVRAKCGTQLLASTSHVIKDLIWPLISAKTPMSSKSPVIVRVVEMPAIDLQHCDAIQSWLSIGPPRSRCHYQDVRAIQSPQGLVQSGLNSRSARMVKSSGSLRGIHRRGRAWNSGECSSKFLWHFGICWELLWNVLPMGSSWLGVIANIINLVCEHLNTGNWLPSMDTVPFLKSLTSPKWAWACSDNRSGHFPVLSWCVSSTPWKGVHWLSMEFRLTGKVWDPWVEVPPVPNPEKVFPWCLWRGTGTQDSSTWSQLPQPSAWSDMLNYTLHPAQHRYLGRSCRTYLGSLETHAPDQQAFLLPVHLHGSTLQSLQSLPHSSLPHQPWKNCCLLLRWRWIGEACSLVDVIASDSEQVATKEGKSLRIVSNISGLRVASL